MPGIDFETNVDTIWNWPPDLFAIASTIVDRSGFYADSSISAHWVSGYVCDESYGKFVRSAGAEWAKNALPPKEVIELWRSLVYDSGDQSIDYKKAHTPWEGTVLKLLTIADEACAGMGFESSPFDLTPIARLVWDEYVWLQDACDKHEQIHGVRTADSIRGGGYLPHIPVSLCLNISPTKICVQPKTTTPSVGCTLRSLSHHVALLPSVTNVETQWRVIQAPASGSNRLSPMNILVVPFPYQIPGKSFVAGNYVYPPTQFSKAFSINPECWLPQVTAEIFSKFLLDLIEIAENESTTIDAVVLPEGALPLKFADSVAEIFAAHKLATNRCIDLFICGVVDTTDFGMNRNSAAIYGIGRGYVNSTLQNKHHRWSLTSDQIKRYNLGHVLDPIFRWWENIDVSCRKCIVNVFRSGASLSVLICEDLARYDPVLPVMNSIGPNLVVALLMDGPQLERRWSGRYATALADDPGSSVLTLTSLGMVARSAMPGEFKERQIALWKEAEGRAVQLTLPQGDHALLLTLTPKQLTEWTLDGREDGGSTTKFSLGAAVSIRHLLPPGFVANMP